LASTSWPAVVIAAQTSLRSVAEDSRAASPAATGRLDDLDDAAFAHRHLAGDVDHALASVRAAGGVANTPASVMRRKTSRSRVNRLG
jgi:hypothetical protein